VYGVGGTESCYLKQSILYNITDWYSPEVSIHKTRTAEKTEPIFLNVYGAQESIPRNEFRQPM
jgi:hypothetical protein